MHAHRSEHTASLQRFVHPPASRRAASMKSQSVARESHAAAPTHTHSHRSMQVHLQPSSDLSDFNDGTMSPFPSDYWNDAYLSAWHCMSATEEADVENSDDYRHFARATIDGKLVVSTSDLTSMKRWQALAFFLSRSTVDVHSLRFQGVDLQGDDFRTFKQVRTRAANTHTRQCNDRRAHKG